MNKSIDTKQKDEIRRIIQLGNYSNSSMVLTRTEYLGLALLKYIVYAHVHQWRWGYASSFRDVEKCGLTKGKRTKAVDFLYKHGMIYPVGKRWVCREQDKLIAGITDLEKKLRIDFI
jgi:hypothetical protein